MTGGRRWRIGLFGGSFDPVHAGHLHVARSAREQFGLDEVVFVPARQPPHKPERVLASGADRLAMLELALAPLGFGCVTPIELGRAGPSYTVDTVRALARRIPLLAEARLFLVLGSDNLAGLPEWREVEALLDRVEPIVVARAVHIERPEALLAELAPRLSRRALAKLAAGFLDLPPVPISSTAVRAALAQGADPDALLPPGVLEYVRAHGVYAPRVDPARRE